MIRYPTLPPRRVVTLCAAALALACTQRTEASAPPPSPDPSPVATYAGCWREPDGRTLSLRPGEFDPRGLVAYDHPSTEVYQRWVAAAADSVRVRIGTTVSGWELTAIARGDTLSGWQREYWVEDDQSRPEGGAERYVAVRVTCELPAAPGS